MNAGGCAGHAGLADELRAHASGALDLLEPWLERVREQPVDPVDPAPASCAVCPLCAVITVLRGGRSDLAVRVAEQASGLVSALRAALDDGVGGSRAGAPGPAASAAGGSESGASAAGSGAAWSGGAGAPNRSVQRIPVSRGCPATTGCPTSEPC